MERILQLLRERGPLANSMVIEALELPATTVSSTLRRLEKTEAVVRLGFGFWDVKRTPEP
jgi:DNA-binding Lrp family transcriptional regulator